MNPKPCSLSSAKRMSLISLFFIFEDIDWSSLPEAFISRSEQTLVPVSHSLGYQNLIQGHG